MKYRSFFLLFPLIFFSGCLNYYQETTIKTDGSGEMFIHYWMKVLTSQDSLVATQFGIFTEDSIRNEFSSEFIKINNIEVYSDGNDSTIHAKVEFEFVHVDSLNKTKAFKEANFSLINGAAGQKVFSQFIPPVVSGFGFDPRLFTISYVYYLPGDIITHNAHEISRNKVTWNYNLSEIGTGKTITATYRPFKLKETPTWIYLLALFVLVVVIVFLFKKNRA